MKLSTTNPNYCATVVTITKLDKLKANKKAGTQACDNLLGTTINGFQAIVGNDTKVGDRGLLFTVETQLSDLFCKTNNLYRKGELNLDAEKKGYMDENGRIRAQKFRGHVSNALFMPLTSLFYYGVTEADLKDGDEFDTINDMQICCKYVVPMNTSSAYVRTPAKKTRVDLKHMPEHFTTPNYFKVGELIGDNENVIITQKIHGTSVRIANTYVERKLTVMDRLAKFFGANVEQYEMDYVFGSRKVIKDANNPDQKHYYEHDVWTQEGKNYIGVIPENFVVYAEIAGKLSNGAEIQKDYSYGMQNAKVYVYRVVTINKQGLTVDLAWDQVKEFCEKYGMLHVPELARMTMKEFNKKKTQKLFIDKALYKKFPQALPVGDGLVDEGVCVRVDRMTPVIMKAKSPIFYEHETKMLDTQAVDVEAEQSV